MDERNEEMRASFVTEELIIGRQLARCCEREKEEAEPVLREERLKIAVTGIARGAGASFLAVALAKAAAGKRSFLPVVAELGGGGIYDALGMDRRFADREFFSCYRALLEGRPIRRRKNLDEGINWLLRCPGEGELSFGMRQRLANNAAGDLIFCDLSGMEQESRCGIALGSLLGEFDHILAVIDPLPSKLLEGCEYLDWLRGSGFPVTCVVNKMNAGVNQKELFRFLGLKIPFCIPLADMEQIYGAEYLCRIPAGVPQIRKILQQPVAELLEQLLL